MSFFRKYFYFPGILLTVISLFLFSNNSYAVPLLDKVSDTISTSRRSILADHTIRFTLTNAIPASGKIIITPETGSFNIVDTLDHTDIDVTVGGIDLSLLSIPGSGAESALGVSVVSGDSGNITIILNDTDAFATNSDIVITIGSDADYEHTGYSSIVNPFMVGSYKIGIETQDSSSIIINKHEAMVAIMQRIDVTGTTADTILPVITLVGDSVISINTGDVYNDDGATALDNIDGDITNDIVTVDPVDTGAAGIYYVTYNVSDSAGNAAEEVTRIVVVSQRAGGGAVVIIPVGPTKVILQGKAYPNAPITVLKDGQVVDLIQADKMANFKSEITDVKGNETYTFGLWAVDKNNIRSITFNFTTYVAIGKTTVISNIFIPPTIYLEKDIIPRGEVVEIIGQTVPESEVTVHINSDPIIEKTPADNEGDWEYSMDTGILEEGSHSAKANALDPGGVMSSFSKTLFFVVTEKEVFLCRGADLNFDNRVDLVDFSILLFFWGSINPSNPCVDINQDGAIDLIDFSIMMYEWTG